MVQGFKGSDLFHTETSFICSPHITYSGDLLRSQTQFRVPFTQCAEPARFRSLIVPSLPGSGLVERQATTRRRIFLTMSVLCLQVGFLLQLASIGMEACRLTMIQVHLDVG